MDQLEVITINAQWYHHQISTAEFNPFRMICLNVAKLTIITKNIANGMLVID